MSKPHTHNGLRAALESFGTYRPTPLPARLATASEHAKIQKRWGDTQLAIPNALDLDRMFQEVSGIWEAHKTLTALSAKQRRWLPWILFYPVNDPTKWLAGDVQLNEEYLQWLGSGERSSRVIILLKIFLTKYPTDLGSFDQWRNGLDRVLNRSLSPRLILWRERCNRFHLLQKDGAREFGKSIQTGENAKQLLIDAGLAPDLLNSAFLMEAAHSAIAETADECAQVNSVPPALKRALVLIQDNGHLRFEALRTHIADSFLLPFEKQNPVAELQAVLEEFFRRNYGDPRIRGAAGWQPIGNRTRDVFKRWLVKATIEDFFKLIDATAYKFHWKYRKAFWRAYIDENAISDAWVVLGRHAIDRGSGDMLSKRRDYGRFVTSTGGQSALLMRIGGMTIAEWSHNGACRGWAANAKGAPELYRTEYSKDSLMGSASFEIYHHGSENGRWQWRLADEIRRHTKIQVMQYRYMP